jgi:hypothetical protein
MYKHFFWFALGWFTCKHVMPVANEVARRYMEEKEAA